MSICLGYYHYYYLLNIFFLDALQRCSKSSGRISFPTLVSVPFLLASVNSRSSHSSVYFKSKNKKVAWRFLQVVITKWEKEKGFIRFRKETTTKKKMIQDRLWCFWIRWTLQPNFILDLISWLVFFVFKKKFLFNRWTALILTEIHGDPLYDFSENISHLSRRTNE